MPAEMKAGLRGALSPLTPISLYVHIPFCETKCPYCDFNTYASIEPLMPSYLAALLKEISLWGKLLVRPQVKTIFFGGGTPSYLPAEHIAGIMPAARAAFDVSPNAEVTLEANPGDFTESKLAAYLEAGISRLSIGVQSLDDRLLKLLGRRHSAAQAVEAYRMAQSAGFSNVSVDLMYGLPRQDMADWRRTLEGALELAPVHVSMYCLTLEGGTPMERDVRLGRLPEPDPDLAADMYLLAQEVMRGAGYRHYEISNWAFPGFESRHNLTYWLNQPYLGVGPGAHSYLGDFRFYNLKSPREYVRRLEDASASPGPASEISPNALRLVPVVESVESIDRRTGMAETMMLGLRLDTGVRLADFQQRFGISLGAVYGETVADLTSQGHLEMAGGSVRLTHQGRMVANQVISRFFG